jgi:hypothetical protein
MSTQSHAQGLTGGIRIERHLQQSAAVATRATWKTRVDRSDHPPQLQTPSLRSAGRLASPTTQFSC